MTKDQDTGAVERLIEAVEARLARRSATRALGDIEDATISVGFQDLRTLLAAARTEGPWPLPEGVREAIARMVDPEGWARYDCYRGKYTPHGYEGTIIAPSLAKADDIMVLGVEARPSPEGVNGELLAAAREGLITAEADVEQRRGVIEDRGDYEPDDAFLPVLIARRDKIAAAIAKAEAQPDPVKAGDGYEKALRDADLCLDYTREQFTLQGPAFIIRKAEAARTIIRNALAAAPSPPIRLGNQGLSSARDHDLTTNAATPKSAAGGRCENKKQPGGCQLHNLQCGWPECDR